ncbi:hypothetical protein ACFPRL_01035 [Pseudoclavibacter helvolus]
MNRGAELECLVSGCPPRAGWARLSRCIGPRCGEGPDCPSATCRSDRDFHRITPVDFVSRPEFL